MIPQMSQQDSADKGRWGGENGRAGATVPCVSVRILTHTHTHRGPTLMWVVLCPRPDAAVKFVFSRVYKINFSGGSADCAYT